jgi:hypothetical protein
MGILIAVCIVADGIEMGQVGSRKSRPLTIIFIRLIEVMWSCPIFPKQS